MPFAPPRRPAGTLAAVTVTALVAGLLAVTPAAAAPAADCTVPVTAIGAVQGSTDASPSSGQTVTVRGVVVGDYEGASPTLRGFYLQDGGDGDPATSDGVFVFDSGANLVAAGDIVQVTGQVGEFQGQTQITAGATGIGGCGTGTVTPAEVTLPLASPDALERYEGMSVRFPQELSVTETFQLGRFGQVVVSSGGRLPQPTSLFRAGTPEVARQQAANALNRLIIDDATNAQNPDPIVFGRGGRPLSASNTLRGGDTVTGATGVLTFTWAGNAASGNAYRLRPVQALNGAATFVAANPRPTSVPEVGGTLTVAGANLLNWFDTTTGCTFGLSGGPADCRGANNPAELERQAAKEVAELNGLAADVVGVVEVENDGYGPDSALADLVERLDAAAGAGAGTWDFVDVDAATGVVDAAGDDAIKVGLLYRPAAVTPLPGRTWADTGQGELWDRVPVAQSFATADGETVTVVVNHFKSKGSCPAATDTANAADADRGDGQSCWNARRVEQAQRLASWLSTTVVPAAGDPDVLVVGDLNSYAGEDPIAVLAGAGYVDLAREFGGAQSYSYGFDGQWGYLDYALSSASLRPQVTGAAEWHVNADEPTVLDYNTEFKTPAQQASLYAPDAFRNSDHDPVRVGLQLTSPAVATTTTVTTSATSVVVGAPVTLTATVTTTRPVAPGGTVRFSVRGVPVSGPVALVDGAATVTVPAVVPGTTTVTATYSGDAGNLPSQGSVAQTATYGLRLVTPVQGHTLTAGTSTTIRYQLVDAAGRPLPDLAALVLGLTCTSTVSVSGAQTLRPTCGRYDSRSDSFTVSWKPARATPGAITVTATVRYPDTTPPTTASAAVTLVR
ncbi:ExeM/NucH family extracellular endonuclease [Nakamurella deserti]|uniref:ExeM/NucH family extracellular endonuclease n=1 Tax=Nakamurella deserti TaxID=2164074 RepID=UPI000DBE99EE|nr:ExeM/NucH family extracellular endonuclease [Nakamurella deserti]